MKITFHGVRGSTPTPEADRLDWGGETTCFLVESRGGTRIVVDAGTGIRRLGRELIREEPGPIWLLLTHFHLDHLMGLVAFAPFYTPGWRLEIMGSGAAHNTEGRLRQLLASPFWPVGVDEALAEVSFQDLDRCHGGEEGLEIGDLQIRWAPVAHPQGCTAFRFDETGPGGGALAIATDMEWPREKKLREGSPPLVTLLSHNRPVDLLVVDSHFTDLEYRQHAGWGHSSPAHALELKEVTGARRVYLTHHAPEHDDPFLDRMAEDCGPLDLRLARQGDCVEVKP